jgi:ankyrin repeat protein
MLRTAVILACILLPASGIAAEPSVNEQLRQAAKNDSLGQIKTLLAKGGDIKVKNKKGETALMKAAWTGNLEVVKFLIDKGADVNVRNNSGETALSLASANNQPEIVQHLKAHGAK